MKTIFTAHVIALLISLAAPASAFAADELIDYSGQAKSLVQQQAVATPKFIAFASGFIEGKFLDVGDEAEPTCDLYRPQFVEVDIDGDGTKEGIATFTMEGCGGGNNWSRLAEVFIKDGDLYRHAGGFQLGASVFGASSIITIRYGILTVGDNSNGDPMFDKSYELKDGQLTGR